MRYAVYTGIVFVLQLHASTLDTVTSLVHVQFQIAARMLCTHIHIEPIPVVLLCVTSWRVHVFVCLLSRLQTSYIYMVNIGSARSVSQQGSIYVYM